MIEGKSLTHGPNTINHTMMMMIDIMDRIMEDMIVHTRDSNIECNTRHDEN